MFIPRLFKNSVSCDKVIYLQFRVDDFLRRIRDDEEGRGRGLFQEIILVFVGND
jgi:hypothetical protein